MPPPTTSVEIAVPMKAVRRIGTMLRAKSAFLRLNPSEKMIIGSRIRVNICVSKWVIALIAFCWSSAFENTDTKPPNTNPSNTTAPDSGR